MVLAVGCSMRDMGAFRVTDKPVAGSGEHLGAGCVPGDPLGSLGARALGNCRRREDVVLGGLWVHCWASRP